MIVAVVVLVTVVAKELALTMLQKQGVSTPDGKPPGMVTVAFTAQHPALVVLEGLKTPMNGKVTPLSTDAIRSKIKILIISDFQ